MLPLSESITMYSGLRISRVRAIQATFTRRCAFRNTIYNSSVRRVNLSVPCVTLGAIFMNLQKFFGIAFSTAVLSSTLLTGISYGASNATGMPGPNTADLSPELQSAAQRVDMSKSKLDQARQQLSAAKAMLRAAEAEFKA